MARELPAARVLPDPIAQDVERPRWAGSFHMAQRPDSNVLAAPHPKSGEFDANPADSAEVLLPDLPRRRGCLRAARPADAFARRPSSRNLPEVVGKVRFSGVTR